VVLSGGVDNAELLLQFEEGGGERGAPSFRWTDAAAMERVGTSKGWVELECVRVVWSEEG
jgi:hypothetical protein